MESYILNLRLKLNFHDFMFVCTQVTDLFAIASVCKHLTIHVSNIYETFKLIVQEYKINHLLVEFLLKTVFTPEEMYCLFTININI